MDQIKLQKLVQEAFAIVKAKFHKIEYSHSDRENEFDNQMLGEILKKFEIKRSLSKKGCP